VWALIIKDALKVVKKKLKCIIEKLSGLAVRYVDAPMPGRTHGQLALPITFRFRFANYVYELTRS
jgi:adenylosuccinate lyase